jgi:hypothetical protein
MYSDNQWLFIQSMLQALEPDSPNYAKRPCRSMTADRVEASLEMTE